MCTISQGLGVFRPVPVSLLAPVPVPVRVPVGVPGGERGDAGAPEVQVAALSRAAEV